LSVWKKRVLEKKLMIWSKRIVNKIFYYNTLVYKFLKCVEG